MKLFQGHQVGSLVDDLANIAALHLKIFAPDAFANMTAHSDKVLCTLSSF